MIPSVHKSAANSAMVLRMARKPFCLLVLALALSAVTSRSQSLPAAPPSDTASDSQMDVLERARSAVEKLFERSGGMTCTEKVTQSILDDTDAPPYEEHSLFNYRFQADSG